MYTPSLVSRCGVSVAVSLMSFAMVGTALAGYVSTQDANVRGNATSDSSMTINATSGNENYTTQRCTRRRARLGMCNQNVNSETDSRTDVTADSTTTATNDVDVDQGANGNGAANGVQTQDADVRGDADADSTAKVTGDSYNYRSTLQQCTVRRERLGLCRQNVETDDDSDTIIDATGRTTATNRRDIRQRARR